ncbi:unnamed protein product [Paramecium pentaurelia]|uniref:Uncharacterized protein n=1 Tax=Paramecium pentaurelia TaxID=43138 RepID=A0A8S1XDL8_9CILI|nr:unnamed protein product [Paramecium pentaurelia]
MKQSHMQHKSWLQLQRFEEYEINKKKYLEKEQEMKFKSQDQQTQQKQINWIGDIHERQTLLQKAKWKWIEEQKKRLDWKREMDQLDGATFHPQILNKDQKIRTPDQFYKDNIDYKNKTEKQIQQLIKQKEDSINNRSCSPKINKKSVQMVVQPFYDRLKDKQLEKEQNLLKIKKSITPSFSPQIYSRNFQSRQTYQTVQQFANQNSTKNKTFEIDLENVKNDYKTFTFFEDIRRSQYSSSENNQQNELNITKNLLLLTENSQILNAQQSPQQCTVKKQQRSVSPLKSIMSKTTQKNYFKK